MQNHEQTDAQQRSGRVCQDRLDQRFPRHVPDSTPFAARVTARIVHRFGASGSSGDAQQGGWQRSTYGKTDAFAMFVAQGACMAIEDAVALSRALEAVEASGLPSALRRCENARTERTAKDQLGSRGNEWLREGGIADWVYGYDAWGVALG